MGGGDRATLEPAQDPGPLGYCLSVRRAPLDHLLVRHATSFGCVTLLERTRVSDVLWAGEQVVGLRLSTPEGERDARARIVVGADGRHSTVARRVRAPVERHDPASRAAYYQYVRGYAPPGAGAPDGPEFSLLGDEIAYIFPSDDGVTCVALSVNLAVFGWLRQAAAERFGARLAAHRGLAGRVAAATPVGPVLACGPEANVVRVPVGPGWALAGDAGLHQDPWSGHGMDCASVHGALLAEALADWFGGRRSEAEALEQYHHGRNVHGLARYQETVEFGRDLRQLGPS